jgi:hypothetical protein
MEIRLSIQGGGKRYLSAIGQWLAARGRGSQPQNPHVIKNKGRFMTNILRRVADSLGRFTPSKPSEYLALQMAKKLGDQEVFRHYLVLFEHYTEDLLLNIYRRCQSAGNLTGAHFMKLLREQTQ